MRKSTDVSFTGWKKLEELEQAQKLEQRRATSKSARMGASSGRRVDWLRSVCTLGDSLRLLRRAVGALASVAASTIGRALALLRARATGRVLLRVLAARRAGARVAALAVGLGRARARRDALRVLGDARAGRRRGLSVLVSAVVARLAVALAGSAVAVSDRGARAGGHGCGYW